GRIDLPGRYGVLVDDFVDHRGDALAGERLLAGQHFVEDDADGKDIAAAINGAPFDLFGGHVTGRAHNMSSLLNGAELQDLGGAEVGHFDGVVGGQHQVGGLDIAVNDVAFVGELQCAARLLQ